MMKKEFKMCPVTKFVAWFILGLIVCIIGISNVFADEITFKVYDYQVYYDNSGSSVSQVGQTYNYSFNAYVSNNITTAANSYGAGVVINSGIPIISGHAYSISFYFIEKGNIALSSKNRIALGSSVSGTASNYANGNYYATMITSKVVNGSTLQFAFTANASYQYIFIPWTTTSTVTQNYVFDSYLINDLGVSSTLSQSDINNSLNSQTNTITSNSNTNRDLIIQNNNDNTQAIIDSNKENFNTCYTNYFNIYNVGQVINSNGRVERKGSTDIEVESTLSGHNEVPSKTLSTLAPNLVVGETYILTFNASDVRNYIYLSSGFVWNNGDTRTITQSDLDSTVYFYANTNLGTGRYKNLMIQKSDNYTTSYIPFGETCTNKLDEQTDAINGINDSINDDNVDSSSWANFFNNFTTNTFGLTSIVTAPLNLIQSLTSTTCADLQLPLPYLQNKYLTLPCMSTIYSQYFGTFFTLYQTITYGIIAYWVCVRIFNLVKDFKNPDHDEIEVVDL